MDNETVNVSAEQHENQQVPPPQENTPSTPPSLLDKILLYVGIVIAVIFAVFAVKAMDRSDVKPSEILENDGTHNLFGMEIIQYEEDV